MNLFHFFNGFFPRIIKHAPSQVNNSIKIKINKAVTTFEVSGFSQSGGWMPKIWTGFFHYFYKLFPSFSPKSIAMFGLAGGTVAAQLKRLWPRATLTVVEIDPAMIALWKKYIHDPKTADLRVINADAFQWIKRTECKYDLIVVDVYIGGQMPIATASSEFLLNLKRILTKNGHIIINTFQHALNQSVLRSLHAQIHTRFRKLSSYRKLNNEILILSQ